MSLQGTEAIIKYIVWWLQDGEWSISKTKIVKLLYLVDVEHFRSYGDTVTGFTWKYHYYGPYTSEVEDVFRRLSVDLPQDEVRTAKGYKAFVFRSSEEAEYEFNEQVSQRVRNIVERILRRWAPEELHPLLSYVYFDTEPMRNAKPGDMLDFLSISRITSESRIHEPVIRLTGDQLAHLKYRLDNYRKKQVLLAEMSEEQGRQLPSPRNRAYVNAKAIMDEEERKPLPVNIDVVVES